jgi:hypothetical protein
MVVLAATLGVSLQGRSGRGQDETLIERKGPPRLDDFESDTNQDGVPDGWYNLVDARIVPQGGVVGPHFVRFESRRTGRIARLSRGFGLDGRKTEALIIGLWIRIDQIATGERLGYEPALTIDFLGDGLRSLTRGSLGPWNSTTVGSGWTRVAKRVPVPPGTRDAIFTVGLVGATGVLDVDGMTFEEVAIGGEPSTNLVVNGGFELGDPSPASWIVENGAIRAFPSGAPSTSVVELPRSNSRVLTALGVPVEPFGRLQVSLAVRLSGLRGAGGAEARMFFLNEQGQILLGDFGNAYLFQWAGSADWHLEQTTVRVPTGAVRAVFQAEKHDPSGIVYLDNVRITASPNPDLGEWVPYHVEDEKSLWMPVDPSPSIAEASALDASYLLDAPAGKHGFVTVRDGHLAFSKGGARARFFGVAVLPPSAFLPARQADALADRLARSGINLVRLGDLDEPLGPGQSLLDDSRDDTKALDPLSLERLDHLIAALKSRGIYVAIELLSRRRFRENDGVKDYGLLPPGGGPAALIDPVITKRTLETARALLGHVNPETGLALRNDPVLAWVTLAGELSLFDLIDRRSALPRSYSDDFKNASQVRPGATGRGLWAAIETEHWKEIAGALRRDKLRVPIASLSHWRKETELNDSIRDSAFDLIDDRMYLVPPPFFSPDQRSALWSLDGAFAHEASRRKKSDRPDLRSRAMPYVVGQWCFVTQGAWGLPTEAADVMLASAMASAEDWDGLVRRGYFMYPQVWGTNSAGTGGADDVFQLPEIVNGMPQVYSLWPHAASLMLRGHEGKTAQTGRRRGPLLPGWKPALGRLVLDTPFTQGIAGWSVPDASAFDGHDVAVETSNPFAVVVVSSVGKAPISDATRLLVTAIARVEPTGYRWVDYTKREVADPGRPPLLQEPVQAKVRWFRKGTIKAYALDNTGARKAEVKLDTIRDGVELPIDGRSPILHWELVAE